MEIKVTYIGHSGFLVETEKEYILFDYYEGDIPFMEETKPLWVFASHRHPDHFNPGIFALSEKHPHTDYVLAYDIKVSERNCCKWKLSDTVRQRIWCAKACETYTMKDLGVTTLKSTDEGVAYLVESEGLHIYHAGDLNWWHWKEESKQWNNNMAADFKREISKLANVSVDIAFLPLDPRLEEDYSRGFLYTLENVDIKTVFPMHMWKEYSVIDKVCGEMNHMQKNTDIVKITKEGQVWTHNLPFSLQSI